MNESVENAAFDQRLNDVLSRDRLWDMVVIERPRSIEDFFRIAVAPEPVLEVVRKALIDIRNGRDTICILCEADLAQHAPGALAVMIPSMLAPGAEGTALCFAVCQRCADAEDWRQRLHNWFGEHLGAERVEEGTA